jgi:hypothetical protein
MERQNHLLVLYQLSEGFRKCPMVYVLGYDTEFDLTAVHDTRKIVKLFVVHCVELTVVVTREICVVMICRRTWTASHVAGRLL